MANKKLLSVVAASVLVATFSLTGCGGGSSSSAATTNVTVSDGYALGATVTATDYTAGHAVEQGKGVYQFPATITGALTAVGGANDVDNNGVKDAGEPYLPTLKAPAGYKNVNSFTTLIVDGGVTVAELIALLQVNASDVNTNFDIDIVAKAKANPKIARGAALYTALISQVAYDTAHPSTSSSSSSLSSSSSSDGLVPGGPGASSSSSSVVSSSSSSSVAASDGLVPGGPGAMGLKTLVAFADDLVPGGPGATSSVASSSSSSVVSSSSSSSSVVSSSSSSSVAPTTQTLSEVMDALVGGQALCVALPSLCTLATAINGVSDSDIAANGMKTLDALTAPVLGSHNQFVPASSSSLSSSSLSSSSLSSSSSSDDGLVPPGPGDIPSGTSSTSSSSTAASSSSTASGNDLVPSGPGA
jgi:hypothetical protein